MGSQMSDADKAAIEKEKLAKEARDVAQEAEDEINRQKTAEQKAQDFEDLLSGKKQKISEKNLQTLFTEFYSNNKLNDPATYVNSAKSSLGGLSSRLEQRRQKLRDLKDGAKAKVADIKNLDKDKTAAAKKPEEEKKDDKKVDESKDTASATEETKAEDSTTDKATETPEAAKEEEKVVEEEIPAEPKLSMKQKLSAKFSAINDKVATKYPNMHEKTSKYAGTMRDVWQETFPDAQAKTVDKMQARKDRAKKAREHEEAMKDMTPEEIEAMEESIPEWKRSALVI